MNKLIIFVKKYAFLEGIVAGILVCVWFYETFRIANLEEGYKAIERSNSSQLQELKLKHDLLKDDYEKKLAVEAQYHEEKLKNRELETKLVTIIREKNEQTDTLNRQLSAKWEEKYRAEKLSRIAIEEELTKLKVHLTDAKSNASSGDNEIQALKDKITILEKERDSLRVLYSQETKELLITQVSSDTKEKSDYTEAESILASLSNIATFDIDSFLISTIPKIKGELPSNIYIKMLSKAALLDRPNIVIKTGKYVQQPIKAADLATISRLLPSLDAVEAMKSLQSSSKVQDTEAEIIARHKAALKIPGSTTRTDTLKVLAMKSADLKYFKTAFEIALDIPGTTTKTSTLSYVALKIARSGDIEYATKVAEKIPGSSTRSNALAKISGM